jgi:hypothetical protein
MVAGKLTVLTLGQSSVLLIKTDAPSELGEQRVICLLFESNYDFFP